jgi:hypothetical protein
MLRILRSYLANTARKDFVAENIRSPRAWLTKRKILPRAIIETVDNEKRQPSCKRNSYRSNFEEREEID